MTQNNKAKPKEEKALVTQEQKQQLTKAIKDQDISDKIFKRVNELEQSGGLDLPGGYSPANALKSAWLMLQNTKDKNNKPILSVCSKDSIANSLLDMVIQGLSPVKKQCYFIAYGTQLQLQRSYLGNVAVTKRLKDVKDVFAQVIYEGDEFEYSITRGVIDIEKHKQSFDNIKNEKIKGAYAIVVRDNAEPVATIMTKDEIQKAWEQGPMKGKSGAHINFGQEMSKKTVINRACKYFFNTSDDSDLLVESIQRTQDLEDVPESEYEEVIENQIEEAANSKEIDVEIEDESNVEDGFFSEEEQKAIEEQEMQEAANGREF